MASRLLRRSTTLWRWCCQAPASVLAHDAAPCSSLFSDHVPRHAQQGGRSIGSLACPELAQGAYIRQRWTSICYSPQHKTSIRGMFIQTQPTPNEDAMMFLPGRQVMGSGASQEFGSARAAMVSPLAKKLFQVDGVQRVFFGSDFVTVTKTSASDWAHIKPEIYSVVTEFFTSGEALISDEDAIRSSDTAIHEDDDETVAMIKELLETRIRPAIQEDGGDLVFKGFDREDGFVRLKLIGACSTCASSTVTLRNGVENMLMHYVPEVKGVEHVQDEDETVGVEEFEKLEKAIEDKRKID